MKEFVRKSLLMSIIVIGIVFMLSGQEAKASTLRDIPLQVVEDIHNTPYPKMTEKTYYYYNQLSRTEFTIETPGEVRAIFRLDQRSKSSGSAWISTDLEGKDIIGKTSYFEGEETGISWFLDKGTYYMFSTYGEIPSEENKYKVDITKANVALLFEKARTHELNNTSSFIMPNILKLKETYRGALTNTSPSDYYEFRLLRKASVTINYSFDTLNSINGELGYCTLYDENELFLMDGAYSPIDRGQQNITCLLEPGTYYVRLNGILGNTTLNVTPMYYDIELTTSKDRGWTTKEQDINIDTSIEYSEIVVLKRDVKESLINNNKLWSSENKAYVPVDGETFTVIDSGVYSVRITDINGHNTMKKIKISNIDTTNPKIVGAKNDKSYGKPITITWSDKQSGIDADKTTLNGKKVKSGIELKNEGKYILKVYDKVGNKKIIKFNIDFTAPTTNVKNKKTYNDIVILQIKDNISGIKKVVVDNVEHATVFSTQYFYLDGEYVVEIWDNADNYRKVEFSIMK